MKNDVRHSLARISLRWMIRQCFLTKTGILFHRDAFQRIGMDPQSLHPLVIGRPRPSPILTSFETVAHTKDSKAYHGAEHPTATRLQAGHVPMHKPLDTAGALLAKAAVSSLDNGHQRLPTDATLVGSSDGGMVLTEEEEEFRDARARKVDQLLRRWMWWLLELVPMKHREQLPRFKKTKDREKLPDYDTRTSFGYVLRCLRTSSPSPIVWHTPT